MNLVQNTGVICHRLVDQQYHKPNDDILMTSLKYGLLGVSLSRTRYKNMLYSMPNWILIFHNRFLTTYSLNYTTNHTLPE